MKIIKLIKEFLYFKKLVEGLDIKELDEELKFKLANSDERFEKEINEVLIYNLAKRMIKEDVPPLYATGFKAGLIMRASLKNLSWSELFWK